MLSSIIQQILLGHCELVVVHKNLKSGDNTKCSNAKHCIIVKDMLIKCYILY